MVGQALPGNPKQSIRDGASQHLIAQLAREAIVRRQTQADPPGQTPANGEDPQPALPATGPQPGLTDGGTRSQTLSSASASTDKLGQIVANLARLPTESPAEPLEYVAVEENSNQIVQKEGPAQHAVSAEQPCSDHTIDAASGSNTECHQSSVSQVICIPK